MNDIYSFTTACQSIPVKVLHDIDLVNSVVEDKFIPLKHIQLCLTNKCNLNCPMCVCRDADRKKELLLSEVKTILSEARRCGCRAVTLTGGGEPLMYKEIESVVKFSEAVGIKVGVVTNGMLLSRLPKKGIYWCRISFDSFRDFSSLKEVILKEKERLKDVVLSFSFVLTNELGCLKELVEFANVNGFSHVRLVEDVTNVSSNIMVKAKECLKGIDNNVIYQTRTNPVRGYKKCLISLLKPTIAADGKIYPCCAIQCAIKKEKHDFPEKYNMGSYQDLYSVIKNQKYFDGSVCDICYYSHYNDLLNLMLKDLIHKEWV